jgi:hypothetical protein
MQFDPNYLQAQGNFKEADATYGTLTLQEETAGDLSDLSPPATERRCEPCGSFSTRRDPIPPSPFSAIPHTLRRPTNHHSLAHTSPSLKCTKSASHREHNGQRMAVTFSTSQVYSVRWTRTMDPAVVQPVRRTRTSGHQINVLGDQWKRPGSKPCCSVRLQRNREATRVCRAFPCLGQQAEGTAGRVYPIPAPP